MIRIEHVYKIYNRGLESEVRALQDVDLSVQAGEMIAITGPSGSGKSTLLHILAGIDMPTSGIYSFEGIDVAGLSDAKRCRLRNREIALIMQDFGLLGGESILHNVCLPEMIRGNYSRKTANQARENLERLGLAGLEKKQVNQLSGGQRQRVAIARAITMGARLILADEPTGALDSNHTEELMDTFAELNQNGTTLLIVTHNPAVAARCPIQYTLRDGILSLDKS